MSIGDYLDTNLGTKLLLDSISQIVAAAPGGIYGPPGLPQGWTPSSGATIVYTADDGRSDWGVPRIEARTTIRCYASGPQACRAVSAVVNAYLHRTSLTKFTFGGRVYAAQYAEKANGPIYIREPDTEWEYDLVTYNIGWIEHTLAS